MKSSAIVCAIAAASLSFASLSFAQGYERHDRGDGARHEQRNNMGRDGDNRGFDQRDQRDQRHDQRGNNGRNGNDSGPRGFDQRDQRHEQQGFNQRNDHQYGARGPQFYRGGHIPMEYRNRQYVVTNWRGHHLSAPPRGQQWVQVGADYVLIAIATGVIAQLILGQ